VIEDQSIEYDSKNSSHKINEFTPLKKDMISSINNDTRLGETTTNLKRSALDQQSSASCGSKTNPIELQTDRPQLNHTNYNEAVHRNWSYNKQN